MWHPRYPTSVAFLGITICLLTLPSVSEAVEEHYSLRLDPGSSASHLVWASPGEAVRARLRVAGDTGTVFERDYGPGEILSWGIVDSAGATLPDGSYRYELWAVPAAAMQGLRQAEVTGDRDAAEAAGREVLHGRQVLSGELRVRSGVIDPSSLAAAAAALAAPVTGADFEIADSSGVPEIRLEDSGVSAQVWDLRVILDDFQIVDQASPFVTPPVPFQIEAGAAENALFIASSGRVGIGTNSPQGTLDVNGTIFQRGGQIHADYVFEPDYQLESIEEHAEAMWRGRHLPGVGPGRYDEQGRAVMELGARSQGMLEELEKAHIYIEQLHREVEALKDELAELKAALPSRAAD